jgi:hypothetical protein
MPPPEQQLLLRVVQQRRERLGLPLDMKVTQAELNAAAQELQGLQPQRGTDPREAQPRRGAAGIPSDRSTTLAKLKTAGPGMIQAQRRPETDAVEVARAREGLTIPRQPIPESPYQYQERNIWLPDKREGGIPSRFQDMATVPSHVPTIRQASMAQPFVWGARQVLRAAERIPSFLRSARRTLLPSARGEAAPGGIERALPGFLQEGGGPTRLGMLPQEQLALPGTPGFSRFLEGRGARSLPAGGAPAQKGTTAELFERPITPGTRDEMRAGISSYTEQKPSPWFSPELYAAKMKADVHLALPTPKDQIWAERVYEDIVIAPARYLEYKLGGIASKLEVSPNFGLFGGREPSIYIRATVPSAHEDDLLRTIVDVADIDFRQTSVLIHKQADLGSWTFGYVKATKNNLAYSIEPMITIKTKNTRITGEQLLKLQKLAEDAGLPGFASTPDKKGIEILNVSRYSHDVQVGVAPGAPFNPYDAFMGRIDEFRKGIDSDAKLRGLFTEIEADVRQLWHYGNRDVWEGAGLEHVGRNTSLPEYQYDGLRSHLASKYPKRADFTPVGLRESDRIALSEKRAADYEAQAGVGISTRAPGPASPVELDRIMKELLDPSLGKARTGLDPQRTTRAERPWPTPRSGDAPDVRIQSLSTDTARREEIKELARQGLDIGGRGFYETEPFRDVFVAKFGEFEGDRQFKQYMGFLAATSPGTMVEPNIRVASNFRKIAQKIEAGIPLSADEARLTDFIARVKLTGLGEGVPEGYGHKLRLTHARGVIKWITGKWDDVTNLNSLKTRSFAEAFLGHRTAVPIDMHVMRIMGMTARDKAAWLDSSYQAISATDLRKLADISPGLRGRKFKYGRGPTNKAGDPQDFAIEGREETAGLGRLKAHLRVNNKREIEFNAMEAVKAYQKNKMSGVDIEDIKDMHSVYKQAPASSEYGPIENFFGEIATELTSELGEELLPYQIQGAVWYAAAGRTGVKSEGTFLDAFRKRIQEQALARNVPELQVLHEFLNAKGGPGDPLGGLLSLLAGIAGAREVLNFEEEEQPVAIGAAQ